MSTAQLAFGVRKRPALSIAEQSLCVESFGAPKTWQAVRVPDQEGGLDEPHRRLVRMLGA
jgi:hypothetical protein